MGQKGAQLNKKSRTPQRRVRRVKKGAVDKPLLVLTAVLVVLGLSMVYSASWPSGVYDYGNGSYFIKGQVRAAILGTILMVVAMSVDYRSYRRLALPIFLITLFSGLLVFTPLAKEVYGAKRWVDLGPISFMPADLIKAGAVLFFASWLAENEAYTRDFGKGMIRNSVIIFIPVAVIAASKDLSTPLILAMTLYSMFLVAGMKISQLVPIALAGGAIIYKAALDPEKYAYRWDRIISVYAPERVPDAAMNIRWQLNHSLYALGIGGFSGSGLGLSTQKYTYLSFAYNDFIFAVIGEEWGLLGTTLVVVLFVLFIGRGFYIASRQQDSFGRYLATGITCLIGWQALVNISAVIGLIPTTGVTLPFFSQGGTSLMVTMLLVGVLLNMSRFMTKRGETP